MGPGPGPGQRAGGGQGADGAPLAVAIVVSKLSLPLATRRGLFGVSAMLLAGEGVRARALARTAAITFAKGPAVLLGANADPWPGAGPAVPLAFGGAGPAAPAVLPAASPTALPAVGRCKARPAPGIGAVGRAAMRGGPAGFLRVKAALASPQNWFCGVPGDRRTASLFAAVRPFPLPSISLALA